MFRSVLQVRTARALAVFIALCVGIVPVAIAASMPPPGYSTKFQPPYRQVTVGSWNDLSPAWSPDGKTIAYSSDENGLWQIFIMNPNGTSNRAITPSSYDATNPSWNPNSSAIAFWSNAGSRSYVRLVFVANSTVVTLTDGSYVVVQGAPEWSPDGGELLFFVESNVTQLVSMDLTSRTLRVVTSVNGSDLHAAWASPSEVMYSNLVNGSYEIDWVDVDSGEGGVVHGGPANYVSPVTSSSSSQVAYIADLIPMNPPGDVGSYVCAYRPGDYNLWVSNFDGSNATFQSGPTGDPWALPFPSPFTPGTIGPTQELAWSSDGRMIAYTASNSFGLCLYLWDVVDSESTINQVGPVNTNSTQPSWSPDNVNLAFASVAQGYYHIFILNTTGLVTAMPYSTTE